MNRDPRHVMACYRQYILGCKKKWGSGPDWHTGTCARWEADNALYSLIRDRARAQGTT